MTWCLCLYGAAKKLAFEKVPLTRKPEEVNQSCCSYHTKILSDNTTISFYSLWSVNTPLVQFCTINRLPNNPTQVNKFIHTMLDTGLKLYLLTTYRSLPIKQHEQIFIKPVHQRKLDHNVFLTAFKFYLECFTVNYFIIRFFN